MDDMKDSNELSPDETEVRRGAAEIEEREPGPTRRERERRDADRILRAVVRACPLPIIALDPDGKVKMWNGAAERTFGWTEQEVVGRKNPIVPEEKEEEEFRSLRDRVREVGPLAGAEVVRRTKDGRSLRLRIFASLVRDPAGEPLGIMAALEDVTERKRLREELREREERFRELADLLPQPVFETDRAGHLTFINDKACELYGYTKEEFLCGFHALQGLSPEDRERGAENLRKVLRGESFPPNEYTAIRKDGVTFPVLIFSAPVVRGGTTVGTRGIIVDIRERKKREEELLKIRKLESIGNLAAGIAHQFNNLVTAILGDVTLAKLDSPPESNVYRILEEAEAEIAKTRDLTAQLMGFSGGGAPEKISVCVGELVRSAARSALRRSNVKCEFSFPDDCCRTEADEALLTQAIGNLFVNAEEAMPDGGTIRVSCGTVAVGEGARLPLQPGDYVAISIKDEGPGIPSRHLGRIFDPYFSTGKEGGGLGLSAAYFAVRKHGGHVEAASEAGAGATFAVYLPASGRAARAESGEEKWPLAGRGKILLMEDSDTLRTTTARLLKRAGYEVEAAKEGEGAVARYREARDAGRPFDAVILDLTVPGGMGGRETVRRLLEIDPDVRAIVSSGYPNDPAMIDPEMYGFRGVVPKPYAVQDMIAGLNRVLHTEK